MSFLRKQESILSFCGDLLPKLPALFKWNNCHCEESHPELGGTTWQSQPNKKQGQERRERKKRYYPALLIALIITTVINQNCQAKN
jgi:hypothetical protein